MYRKNKKFSSSQEDNILASQVLNHIHKYIMHVVSENLPIPDNMPDNKPPVSMDRIIQDIFKQYFSGNMNQLNLSSFESSTPSSIPEETEDNYRSEDCDSGGMIEIPEDTRAEAVDLEDTLDSVEEKPEEETYLLSQHKVTPAPIQPPAANRIMLPGKMIGLQPDVVTTHRDVIILITLPQGIREDNLGISIHQGYAVIKWRHGYMEQIIPIPSDVIKENAVAEVKDSILEIKIPRMQDSQVRRIDIDNYL